MQKANVLISKSDSRMKNAGTKKAPFQGLCGVPGATRTPGLPLRRRSLYPTELREHGLWGVAQGECTSSALGGGRSILLSYGNKYAVVRRIRARGKRNYTEAAGGLSTSEETNAAQRAAT